ncbi:MAG TPA: hypothetical protein VFD52_03650 [Clostridia bacterium]|nr:hypothetical protein [Clostridia bacterium]
MSKKKKHKKSSNSKRKNSNSYAKNNKNLKGGKKRKATKKSIYRPQGTQTGSTNSKTRAKEKRENKPKNQRLKTTACLLFSKLKRMPKRMIITIVSIVVVIAIALAINGDLFNLRYEIPQVALQDYAGVNEDEKKVRDIDIGIKEQHERADKLRVKGDKDAFKFFVRKELLFDEWNREAPFTFGNVATNDCILIVTLLDEDDNMIYRSKGLEPSKYIPRIKLFHEMPYGSYDINMVVVAYDKQTREKIGTQYTQIRMVIGIEYNQEEQTETTTAQQ